MGYETSFVIYVIPFNLLLLLPGITSNASGVVLIKRNINSGFMSPPHPGFHSPGFFKSTKKTITTGQKTKTLLTHSISLPVSTKPLSATVFDSTDSTILSATSKSSSPTRSSSLLKSGLTFSQTGSAGPSIITAGLKSTDLFNDSIITNASKLFSSNSIPPASSYPSITGKHWISRSTKYSVITLSNFSVRTTLDDSMLQTLKIHTANSGNVGRYKSVIVGTLTFTIGSVIIFLILVYTLRTRCSRSKLSKVAPRTDASDEIGSIIIE